MAVVVGKILLYIYSYVCFSICVAGTVFVIHTWDTGAFIISFATFAFGMMFFEAAWKLKDD